MDGLLGKITSGIQGILGNPIVQGVGGALAFGANPLLGLLAASGIQDSRESRELRNDALRQNLAAARRREGAIGELTGLLGSNTTVQAPSRLGGLLDVEGGSPATFNLPGRRESVPTINTAQGQRQAQGLLGQISPDNAAVSLLGQINPPQRVNSRAQSLAAFEQAVGRPATEAEAQNIFGAAGAPLDPNLKILTDLRRQDAEKERSDAALASKDAVIDSESALTKAGKRVESIIELTGDLIGTPLQPGLPAAELREGFVSAWSAVQQLVTGEIPATQGQLATLDKFQKETANLLIGISSSLSGSGGLGTFTDNKLELLKNAMASENIQPQAIIGIMSSIASDLLTEERKLQLRNSGFSIPNREILEVIASGNVSVDQSGVSIGTSDPLQTGPAPPPGSVRVN